MRKKLIAIVGAGVLLTGCSGATPEAESSPAVSDTTASPSTTSKWDDMTFCEAFEDQRSAYQEALDSPDGVRVSELEAEFNEWSDKLKTSAPVEMAEDVATFTAPIYMTESATVSLIDVFAAGNTIGGYCIMGN